MIGQRVFNDHPLVAAVVLNWNKAEQTAACVMALRRQTHPNLTIIVVDNGSAEESLGPLLELEPSTPLLRNGRNLGFTGGVNVGIQRAIGDGAEYVWLVNNDAEPADDVLEVMLDFMMDKPGIGLASPLIRNADADDAIEFCGGLWWREGASTTDDLATYGVWSANMPERIWLVGTALLISRKLIETIGLFDERFFAYWEDNDYSIRCIQAGFRNVVVPQAVVRHWSGTPKIDPTTKPPHYHYYMARNELFFLRKHVRWREAAKPLIWAVMRHLRQLDRLRSSAVSAEAVLAGLWDGVRGHAGSYDARSRLSTPLIRVVLAARALRRHSV